MAPAIRSYRHSIGRVIQGDYRRRASGTSPVNRGSDPSPLPSPLQGEGVLLLLAVFFRVGLAFGLARQLPALADARLFADLAAQVIEPALADVAVAEDVDLVDPRRVDHEGALDSDAVGHAAHREVLAQAAAGHADDRAFEHLDALSRALHDLRVHLDRVARAKRGDLFLLLLLLELLDDVHVLFNSLVWAEVRSAAWRRRHCLMRAWSPERSTSGTINPR